MYCGNCGVELDGSGKYCPSCGRNCSSGHNLGPKIASRPMAGIAVGSILGVIGLLWSIATLFKLLYGTTGGSLAAMFETFPALNTTTLLSTSVGITGHTALLVGTSLSFLRHPRGNQIVRLSCIGLILAILITAILNHIIITSSDVWATLPNNFRGGLVGGVIGAAIGGIAQWSVVMFLFRKRRWA